MEVIKQILRLKQDGVSTRESARRLGISRNSVKKYLFLLQDPPLIPDDLELAARAYNNDSLAHDAQRMAELQGHFSRHSGELTRTGVTRQLLWQEYLGQHPDGYSYSRYCHHLRRYLKSQDLAMHLEYTPGDMIMADFAGKKPYYTDPVSGQRIACEVFVSILPASGLIFCKVVASQKTADYADCVNDMLRFYGGVPATILCDNLKTAVIRPCRYEPVFTELCELLSTHYGTTFSATRPYSPRDKAMVESAVNIVYRGVYAPLRDGNFNSLAQLNEAFARQLALLNDKPYKKTPYSRNHYFVLQERSLLRPLATEPFVLRHTAVLTVQRNYHIQLSEDRRYYSVPYRYAGQKVKVYYDSRVVEVYLHGDRIAVHPRTRHDKAYTTLKEHMPPHHQRMEHIRGWNRDDLLAQARRIGVSTAEAAALMLQNSIYREQNYKACYGMLMLARKFTPERLESACSRVLQGQRVNYTLIKNILERNLDRQIPEQIPLLIPDHENIRGKEAYQ